MPVTRLQAALPMDAGHPAPLPSPAPAVSAPLASPTRLDDTLPLSSDPDVQSAQLNEMELSMNTRLSGMESSISALIQVIDRLSAAPSPAPLSPVL